MKEMSESVTMIMTSWVVGFHSGVFRTRDSSAIV